MTIALFSTLFLVFNFVMAGLVIGLFARYLDGRSRTGAIAAFLAWLLYAGVLGYEGVIASQRPPGLLFLMGPVLVFLFLFLARHPGVRQFAQKTPPALLIGLQVFRVIVELGFYELYRLGLVPRLLTFEGANLDILVGFTAPLVAWLYTRGRINAAFVRVWSVAGIAVLANIIVLAVLTSPGPLNLINTEVPNRALGMFPFTYIAGFLAPLALYLHVLLLRSLPRKQPLTVPNQ